MALGRSTFLTFDGHRIHLTERGAGEPVLLVHGFADSAYTWHRNVDVLAGAGFHVLAYDQPGHGESSLPRGYRFGVDDLAGVALGVLDALGVERAHVVGSSMGGGVALYLAVHHPDRVCRVVAVAPVCYHPPFRPFIFLLRCPPFLALARWLAGPWLVGPVLRSQYADLTLLTPEVLDHYRRCFERPEYVQACAGMARDYWNRAFYETARRYGEVRAPLHLIWGERDTWVPPHRFALRLAADTGAPLILISGAGHLVQQARPEPFNRALRCALGKG